MLGTTRKMSVFVATLISALLFVEGLALATIIPVQITTDPANQGRPEVSGDIIVWKDLRNGNFDIYMHDLSDHSEHEISINPAYQNVPATNGSTVVWQDDRAGQDNNDLYMRKAPRPGETPENEQMLVTGMGQQLLPAVSGNTVVYVNELSGAGTETEPQNDIYKVDLETREVLALCSAAGSQWQPRIDGTRVVWQDFRNGNWDIYTQELGSSDPEQPVTLSPYDDKVADVSGDLIVWQRNTGGVNDIFVKDLSTGDPEQQLTNDAAYQSSPRVSGDLIVWESYDYQRGNWDVFMKDTTSGELTSLAASLDSEARPAVDGETVVWQDTDSATGNTDVWMAHVADINPPQVNNAAPADGAALNCDRPLVSGDFSDNRTGIDADTVRIEVDGEEVTGASAISEAGFSFQPETPLDEGTHTVTVSLADRSGNPASSSWQFETSAPELTLSMAGISWGSYEDYSNRELSVRFRFTNPSNDSVIHDAEVAAASATGGVIMITPTPLPVGEIYPQESPEAVLKYKIPEGAGSFRTSVYVGLTDDCGAGRYLPGPPPGG